MLQVVWFKRDLRLADHGPLADAAGAGAVLPVYAAEPALWQAPDRSSRHWRVLRAGLEDLDANLRALGTRLYCWPGEILPCLETLLGEGQGFVLHAHEETGNGLTFERDIAVRCWCAERGIEFRERAQFGVVRPLRDRDGWSRRWNAMMVAPVQRLPRQPSWAAAPPGFTSPGELEPRPAHEVSVEPPIACGRKAALDTLRSFLDRRGEGYSRNISSPLSAEHGGSRLSVHLSLGTISMRECYQALQQRRAALRNLARDERGSWAGDLKAFAGRLHWHCHFMQKLEDEPRIEFENLSRSCDGLREGPVDAERLRAWAEGETGYPFLDACMRSLNATGWINFRMRAMLMSFAAYDLWLHWREPALHLARQFADYEPGIHYPQVQMQAGTTGINTLRIYNPVKQGLDHDPDGEFIARWLPELAGLPAAARHEPWKADAATLSAAGVLPGQNYPGRIVEHVAAARHARAAMTERRRGASGRAEAKRILSAHGSRRAPAPRIRRARG